MGNLGSPQSFSLVLSALGVFILLACLVLIVTKRVPDVRPQSIKWLGLDLNVSLITLLVLVGLALALTSTYIQIKNYDEQLRDAEQQNETLEAQLRRAGKLTVTAELSFEGMRSPQDMPKLQNVYGHYYLKGPDGDRWVENVKITKGVYPLNLHLTLENIHASSTIERIELIDKNPKQERTWVVDNVGNLLAPKIVLKEQPTGE